MFTAPELSFKQAAERVGLPIKQCEKCRGAGYLRATLAVTTQQLYTLAKHAPNSPVPVVKEECRHCQGAGWYPA
jgi:hypothetical protein